MRTNELTALASKRMRGAVTPAASLVLALLLLTWGLGLASRAVSLLLALLFSGDAALEPYRTWIPAAIGSALSFLIVLPLHLSMRRWIWQLDEEIRPLREAFYYFSSFSRFVKAFGFVLVDITACFLALLICFFPAAVVWTAVAVIQIANVWTVIALVFAVLLLLLGLFFAGWFITGRFLASCCFLAGLTENPFRAIALSFRLMRGKRRSLFALFFHLLPYFLIVITIIFLPFAVPHIESCFALWAKCVFAERIHPADYTQPKEDTEYVFTE